MKKICIFGADGRTGKLIVVEALSQGYSVRAFVYSKSHGLPEDENLEVYVGDALDVSDVDAAVSGVDAVISALGHIKGSDPLMQTKATQNIVLAMKKHGVKRIISLTGTGVREEGDNIRFWDKVSTFVIKTLDPARVMDGIEHAKVLKESGLDWSILRVMKLGGSSGDVDYYLTAHGPVELLSHRNRVAVAMVDLLRAKEWIKKSPILSK